MATLALLLEKGDVTLAELQQHLNGIDAKQRVEQVCELNRKHQEKLWDLAELDPEKLSEEYLVPKDAEPLKPYPFEGKNSLPAFTRFRKVFYRTPDGKIGGYNDQKMAWVTGPGYYVAHESPGEKPGPVVVDYTMIPEHKPADWPEIRPNEQGLSRFVYGGNHDFLRYVSDDVVIGRAYKAVDGRPLPNWFVLVRPA